MAFTRYNGSAWVEPETVKRLDGSQWVDCQFVKRWDGTQWVDAWTSDKVYCFIWQPPGNSAYYRAEIWEVNPSNMVPTKKVYEVTDYAASKAYWMAHSVAAGSYNGSLYTCYDTRHEVYKVNPSNWTVVQTFTDKYAGDTIDGCKALGYMVMAYRQYDSSADEDETRIGIYNPENLVAISNMYMYDSTAGFLAWDNNGKLYAMKEYYYAEAWLVDINVQAGQRLTVGNKIGKMPTSAVNHGELGALAVSKANKLMRVHDFPSGATGRVLQQLNKTNGQVTVQYDFSPMGRSARLFSIK